MEGTECTERCVAPVVKTGKGRQVPAGSGNKENVYPKAVTGFSGESGSRGRGVETGPHAPRSAWEARQVAMAWSHVRVWPESKDHRRVRGEIRRQRGKPRQGCHRRAACSFPKGERDLSMLNADSRNRELKMCEEK